MAGIERMNPSLKVSSERIKELGLLNSPPPLELRTGFLGRVIGAFNSPLLFFAPVLISAIGGVGNGIGWLGKKLGRYGTPLNRVSVAMNAPGRAMEGHTVDSLATGTKEFAANTLSKVGLTTPADAVRNAKVSSGIAGVLGRIGSSLEIAIDQTRLGKWRSGYVERNTLKSGAAHNDALAALNVAKDAVQGPQFRHARKVLDIAEKEMRAAGKAGLSPERMQRISEVFGKATNVKTNGLGKEAKKTLTTAISTANSKIVEFAQNTLKSGIYGSRAQVAGNLKTSLGNIPQNLASMNAGAVAQQTLHYAFQAGIAYEAVSRFGSGIKTLKHMYASITGMDVRNVSTFKILFGKLPEAMKTARREYLYSALPSAGLGTAAIVAGQILNSPLSGVWSKRIGTGVQMVGMTGSGLFTQQNNSFSTYMNLAQAQAQGAKLPPGAYVGLLLYCSEEASRLGPNNAALLKVAQQYAEQSMPAGLVLREIENKDFSKRLAEANASKEAAPSKPDIQIGHTRVASNQAAAKGFVAAEAARAAAASRTQQSR